MALSSVPCQRIGLGSSNVHSSGLKRAPSGKDAGRGLSWPSCSSSVHDRAWSGPNEKFVDSGFLRSSIYKQAKGCSRLLAFQCRRQAACDRSSVGAAEDHVPTMTFGMQRRDKDQFGQGRISSKSVCKASKLSNPQQLLAQMVQQGPRDGNNKITLHDDLSESTLEREPLIKERVASQGRRRFVAASTCLCTALTGVPQRSHAEATSRYQEQALCSQCSGSGAVNCNLCEGSGQWLQGYSNGREQRVECPQCSGRGMLKCVRCLGTGLGDTGGLLRGAAVKEGHMRVRADGSLEILDCDYFPATRGKDCRPSVDDHRITEDKASTSPRGGLYPRPDFVDIAKKTWRIIEKSVED